MTERVEAWVAAAPPGLVDAFHAVMAGDVSQEQKDLISEWVTARVTRRPMVGETEVKDPTKCPVGACTRDNRHGGRHNNGESPQRISSRETVELAGTTPPAPKKQSLSKKLATLEPELALPPMLSEGRQRELAMPTVLLHLYGTWPFEALRDLVAYRDTEGSLQVRAEGGVLVLEEVPA